MVLIEYIDGRAHARYVQLADDWDAATRAAINRGAPLRGCRVQAVEIGNWWNRIEGDNPSGTKRTWNADIRQWLP